jgi:hypothetical protein
MSKVQFIKKEPPLTLQMLNDDSFPCGAEGESNLSSAVALAKADLP